MDDEIDECEYLPEYLAIRRLLSFIRQTQSDCTDTGCLDLMNRNPQVENEGGDFVTMTMLLIFAAIMFFISWRSSPVAASNTSKDSQNSFQQPRGDRRDPPATN